ncbi:uncharacterized protein N7459_004477 [Penicillium hispanicum]|uniref:uncharacterized protein n=1 Tax=Penicillium hispanicum TaxID=1080232 RepID=UPI00253F96D1|nr:uncharacterized protein N7459_004477 [Penicillium hispanicum]KAJ5584677.1 hypothetical protein N7459_004477 [Penicillium hispanicum]
MSEQPQPYTISVPDEALQELKQRLALARFPSQLESAEHDTWDVGVPAKEVQRLAAYWNDGFNWRNAEAQLNELPQYHAVIEVEGFSPLNIHWKLSHPAIVHQVSPVKDAIPLLFCHGCKYHPSPRRHTCSLAKLLPLLKASGDHPAFHVVAPSLPNFGFSSGVTHRGFGLAQYAEALHKLMLKLGYGHYVTQGGDWGFWVTRSMGLLYPEHCKASHVNMIVARPPQWRNSPLLALKHALLPYSAREQTGRAQSEWFDREGYGYNLLQSTKPQTIATALADSPIALLTWIYEKLHDWTDAYPWTDDEILTWVSIYWFSVAGPEASVRIYHEVSHAESTAGISYGQLISYIPNVKLGIVHLPQEISVVPDTWAATLGPIVHRRENDRGGHFAAWEVPEVIVEDLWAMYGNRGPCFQIVPDRSGY